MIVPMKRVYLVLLDSRRKESLTLLKKIGVVHVETLGKSTTSLEQVQERRQALLKALQALPLEASSEDSSLAPVLKDEEVFSLASKITHTAERLRILKDERDKLNREMEFWKPWGDFSPDDIRSLEEKGILFRLYEVNVKDLPTLPNTGKRFIIWQTKKSCGIGWNGSRVEDFPLGIEPLPLPKKGLSNLQRDFKQKQDEICLFEKELNNLASYKTQIQGALQRLDEQVEFEQVSADLTQEGILLSLSGFVPAPKVDDLRKTATEHGWGLLIRDPESEESVPTKIENPRWIRIVQPVFQLLGTVPGYREVDISFFFLLFFSLFFAMIIGDAGYGVILFSLSLYFSLKERKRTGTIPDGLILLLLMGIGTIVWGSITGNWFGFEPISQIPPFSWLVVPSLSAWDPRTSETIKYFTFIVGTIHLTIAHGWNFLREINRKPRIRAFAQLGWLSMVLGLYFLVLNLALDSQKYPVPPFAVYMMGAGLLSVFLFGQQEGNFIKGVIKGFGGFITTFLSSISVFSDIVSYIRLFAVGLATIEIAKSFNDISVGLMTNPLGIVVGILVIILGHGLNLAMGGLAVVVHGVRLNLLEFSNHLGLEWSGFTYRPFREPDEN